jgi:hypothetical protein
VGKWTRGNECGREGGRSEGGSERVKQQAGSRNENMTIAAPPPHLGEDNSSKEIKKRYEGISLGALLLRLLLESAAI